MSRSSNRGRRERGTASLEFVGILPTLLLSGMIALQFGVVGWTAVSTTDAARAAARAASLGQNPYAAAAGALPGSLTPVAVVANSSGQSRSYTVTVKTPSLLPGLDLGTVSRTVDMPAIK